MSAHQPASIEFEGEEPSHLGDFTTDPRVLVIAAIAVVVGLGGLFSGLVLLELIRLATNLAYFGKFSLADLPIASSPLGVLAVFVPVLGALIIGLMARYGSERIRGHGILEAIEAILLGRSRLSPKWRCSSRSPPPSPSAPAGRSARRARSS